MRDTRTQDLGFGGAPLGAAAVRAFRSVDWAWIVNRLAWAALAVLYLIILHNYFWRGEWGNDARAYWTAWPNLYDAPWHGRDSYVDSPACAQVLRPLTLLPWPAFFAVWVALQLGVLVLLTGPVLAAILVAMVQPFWKEIAVANIDFMIGLAIVVGFRYPATWSFVLLTKVTPGIGLLWFAVRREWRSLGIALGATLAIAAGSSLAGRDSGSTGSRSSPRTRNALPTFRLRFSSSGHSFLG
jgi:hypothetical protein